LSPSDESDPANNSEEKVSASGFTRVRHGAKGFTAGIGNSYPLGVSLEGNECADKIESRVREFGDARSVGSSEDIGIELSTSRDSKYSWLSRVFA